MNEESSRFTQTTGRPLSKLRRDPGTKASQKVNTGTNPPRIKSEHNLIMRSPSDEIWTSEEILTSSAQRTSRTSAKQSTLNKMIVEIKQEEEEEEIPKYIFEFR